MSEETVFVVDASALIDLETWFRKATFPSLWQKLLDMADQGLLICPRAVLGELEKKSENLHKCLKHNPALASDEVTVNIIEITKRLDKKYPKLKIGERRSTPNPRSADPWIVALALHKNGTVVSSEKSKPNAMEVYKIPDACRLEGVPCMKLPDFFEAIGIKL